MKKILICGIAATSFFSANAQIDFGVKAGLNMSNITGLDANSNNKLKTGFFAGIASDIKLGGGLHLKPELVYAQQGTNAGFSNGFTIISYTDNLNYLNLPILLAYQFKKGLFLQTGPQIGFLLSANYKEKGQTTSTKDYYNKTDLSWGFGAGYKFAKNLAVDLRYNLGLSKIDEDGEKAYNAAFQLGVAYYFTKK